MKRVCACVLLTGCLRASPKSEVLKGVGASAMLDDGGGYSGNAVSARGGYAGVDLGIEVHMRDVTRPGDLQAPTVPGEVPHPGPATTATALGGALDLRASLFGILATDHHFERYLDVGLDAGAGAGGAFASAPHRATASSSVWYGAWADVGTVRVLGGVLTITTGIRREVFSDPFYDQTELLVGVGWRRRYVPEPGSFTLRD